MTEDTSPERVFGLDPSSARVLKDEGDHSARLVAYESPVGKVVLKSWKPGRSRVFRLWARWLMGREIRFSRHLDGTPGVPRFRGQVDGTAFLMEWVPGEPLARHMPQERIDRALDNFEAVLAALHARRFVHLDLHQRLNLLVGPECQVWVVDLGQGLLCERLPARWLFRLLSAVDRRAVVKFRARYAAHTLPDATRARLVARHSERRGRRWKQFHRRVRELLIGDRS